MYSLERTNGLGEHSGGCSMWQVPRSPLEWGIMTSESADLHSLSSWSLLVAAVRGHPKARGEAGQTLNLKLITSPSCTT
jgi:hypothetical protein